MSNVNFFNVALDKHLKKNMVVQKVANPSSRGIFARRTSGPWLQLHRLSWWITVTDSLRYCRTVWSSRPRNTVIRLRVYSNTVIFVRLRWWTFKSSRPTLAYCNRCSKEQFEHENHWNLALRLEIDILNDSKDHSGFTRILLSVEKIWRFNYS
jgi:hypothetical protein